ncbi:predicted protein [Chaetomium globosum CBS 148.51]|uniref:Uncharacterized protein n=1 Tax=Chaetomium globosum (strain ATCC 6205 / CBS 148.51 / DSM 1962 / NBRC 6347 / NRRL 1970) TaxID=306901 RepID=Q2HBB0_CHAGB|nr:uncharacterized protein CHGG_02494 [Chaetomium globosum CBS 148.51]EAQ90559.1 predicted protein [Chaetomium globosum CBS 148.51]
MRKRSVGGLSVPRGSRGSGLTGCSQQRTDTDRVAVRRGAVCLGCTSRREEGRGEGGGLWRLRGDNAGDGCAARETGLGIGTLSMPVQRCKYITEQPGLLSARLRIPPTQAADPVESQQLETEARPGKEPPRRGFEDWAARAHGIGKLASRLVYDAGQPGPMDAAHQSPGTHTAAAGSSYPHPRGRAWRLFSSKGDKRGSEPWLSAVRHGVADFRRCMQW